MLAKADSKPVNTLLIEAHSNLDQITAGNSTQEELNRIIVTKRLGVRHHTTR